MAAIDRRYYYHCHLHANDIEESPLINSLSIPSSLYIHVYFSPLLEYLTGIDHIAFFAALDQFVSSDESIRASSIRAIILDAMPFAEPWFIDGVVPFVSSSILDMANLPCNRKKTVLSINLCIDCIVNFDEIERVVLNRVLMQAMEDLDLGFEPASEVCIDGLERIRVEDSDEVGDCRICLEEHSIGEEVIRLPCKHVFHGDCIIEWLQTSHLCPLCRFAMPVNDYDTSQNQINIAC